MAGLAMASPSDSPAAAANRCNSRVIIASNALAYSRGFAAGWPGRLFIGVVAGVRPVSPIRTLALKAAKRAGEIGNVRSSQGAGGERRLATPTPYYLSSQTSSIRAPLKMLLT